jgi:hypothetical protein
LAAFGAVVTRTDSGRIEIQTSVPGPGANVGLGAATSGPIGLSRRTPPSSSAPTTRPLNRLVSPMKVATARDRGRR